MKVDRERVRKVRRAMERSGIDAVVCRYPENVCYLSGYWPITGWSLVVFPLEGETTLIVPTSELEYARDGWVDDIRAFGTESLDEVWNPYKRIEGILREVGVRPGAKIGCELSFEKIAMNYVCGEINFVSGLIHGLIREVWQADIVDVTESLHELRMVKTEAEIGKVRLANDVAIRALERAREAIKEGVRESEIAAEAEKAVYVAGTGYGKRAKRERGFAFVMSGPNSSKAWYPFNISTGRRVRRGDIVLLELNVCVDGYWSDLTRTWVLGRPDGKQSAIHAALIEAQDAAVDAARDGALASEVDRVARDVIEREGYGRYFPHRLGHGIGLRAHEPPDLHPASKDVLRERMTHTVEPGVYTAGYGIRVEDDVLVTKGGALIISRYDRSLEA